jgi:HEAT repeat protein
VASNTVEILVAPPELNLLSAEARQAFLADLRSRFHRDAWSAMAAHDLAVKLGPAVVPELIEAVNDRTAPDFARMWLATALCDIPDARAVAALGKLLDDGLAGVRQVVGYHGPKQRDGGLDERILAVAQTGKDANYTGLALLGFLVFRGQAPEPLIRASLESEDARTRATAGQALKHHANDFNIERLTGLLKDKDPRVRAMAASLLGKLGRPVPAALGAMVAALDASDEPTRQKLCQALGELTGKDMPYDPGADATERTRVIQAWQRWWADQQKPGQ